MPTISRPYQVCLDSLAASLPLIEAAGWDHYMANSIGCPYISRARATMLRKAMDAKADVIVFIDHDLSWRPQDLLKLIEAEGDVVAGTYRFKKAEEEYMGSLITDFDGYPIVRADGGVKAHCVPAGFLKVTRGAVNRFMLEFPEYNYIDEGTVIPDLFAHGVHKHVWWGEDYAFSRNWNEKCGVIYILPDLHLDHHLGDERFAGNFHEFLLRQEGGSKSDNPRLKVAA